MQEKNLIISLIVLLIVILVGVFVFGYFLGQRRVIRPLSLLDSGMLQNWMAFSYGEVKEISGRDLVLVSNGETLKIFVSEKAKIQLLNSETKEIKKAEFEDIKVGNRVEIQVAISPKEKILTGYLINILP